MESAPEVLFGPSAFHGTLALILPDITLTYTGDLLTLTTLDIFASRLQVSFDFSVLWTRLLNLNSIIDFTACCGRGYRSDIARALEIRSHADPISTVLATHLSLRARQDLLAVLVRVKTNLGIAAAKSHTPAHANFRLGNNESERYYDTWPATATQSPRHKSEPKYRGAHEERQALMDLLDIAISVAAEGPPSSFSIQSCRQGRIQTYSSIYNMEADVTIGETTEISSQYKDRLHPINRAQDYQHELQPPTSASQGQHIDSGFKGSSLIDSTSLPLIICRPSGDSFLDYP